MNLESCPSWPKEHDWKSCNRSKPVRGFESLALRQNEKQVARPAFCFGKKEGFEQGGSRHSLRKKTVRWTVFADVVKEQSDAKAHWGAPKKSLALRHKSTVILIELRWTFSMPENRLIQGFSAVSAYNEPRCRVLLRQGFMLFTAVLLISCAVTAICRAIVELLGVIVKQPLFYNTAYEKIGDEVHPWDTPLFTVWQAVHLDTQNAFLLVGGICQFLVINQKSD